MSYGLRLQKYFLKAFKGAGNEAELNKKFLNGLLPDFKKDLVAYDAINFDDTLQIACKYEKILTDNNSTHNINLAEKVDTKPKFTSSILRRNSNSLERYHNRAPLNHDYRSTRQPISFQRISRFSNRHQDRQSSSDRSLSYDRNKPISRYSYGKHKISSQCYSCRNYGHLARNCPNSAVPTCFKCQKPGHVARYCPVNLNH